MPEPVTIAKMNVLSIGGWCPVQGYGTVTDWEGTTRAWYFRARGDRWRLSIGKPDGEIGDYVDALDADLTVEGEYGDHPYAAGYMPEKDAMKLIRRGTDLWLSGTRGYVEVDDA